MAVESFNFFKSYADAGETLYSIDPVQYAELMRGVLRYMFEDEEPALDGIAKGFFILMKPVLDKSKSRSEAGKKAGSNVDQKESKTGSNADQKESKTGSNADQKETEKDKGIGERIKDQDKDKGSSSPDPCPEGAAMDPAPEIPKSSRKRTARKRYGKYGNVLLSDKEYENILRDFGKDKADFQIGLVDEFCEKEHRTYSNFAKTVRNWTPGGVQTPRAAATNSFNRFQQNQYDFAELEKSLTG